MKINRIQPADFEQIYELFLSAQIKKQDLSRTLIPKAGFYEYHLNEQDFRNRLRDNSFSLSLKNNHGKILAYLIAYSLNSCSTKTILSESHVDPVLNRLKYANKDLVYSDQFFVSPSLPIFIAGRLADAWDYIIQGENIPGVVAAIPQKPWKNEASTRFVLCRGFSRKEFLKSQEIELGLFVKPYCKVGDDISIKL